MAATLFDGIFRLTHKDANDNTIAELLEKNQAEFGNVVGTPQADPQKMPKIKKQLSTIMGEDDKLVISLYLDTAATEASSGNAIVLTFRIPITIKNIRTGVVYESTLGSSGFTTKITSVASKVHNAATWTILSEKNIPAQTQYKLGHNVQDVRVDSAINLYGTYVA